MISQATGIPKEDIYAIPDVPNDNEWVDHVKQIVPRCDEVHSGNKLVQRLFKDKGHLVYDIEETEHSATKIRTQARAGHEVSSAVPKEVLPFLRILK